MKFSICFCYRNREEHLNIAIPKIKEYLTRKGIDHELIVVEQNDNKKFRRANLLNEGARFATGDVLVFHDIDHIPIIGDYWDGETSIYLPIRRTEFKKNDLTTRPVEDIPSGYRHFSTKVDEDYYGGVITFTKEAFYKINGFNPLFVGWGFEDADLRERVAYHKMNTKRSNNGLFFALEHPDSGVGQGDPDLQNNVRIWSQCHNYLDKGVMNQPSKVEEITPKHSLVDKWILATDFDEPPPMANTITFSSLD